MKNIKINNTSNTMILCAGRGKRMSYKTKYIAMRVPRNFNFPKPSINLPNKYLYKNCNNGSGSSVIETLLLLSLLLFITSTKGGINIFKKLASNKNASHGNVNPIA